MIQIEHDHVGRDYTASIKAMNPSLGYGTGIFMGSFMQSITPGLALGIETVWQRPQPGIEDAGMTYLGRYTGKDWIATAQLVASQGVFQATYWQRLADRIDAAVELSLLPDTRPGQRQAVATAGVRYDLRSAGFRGQIDSTGKVSAFLEQRFTPAFAFLVSGEIDQWKVFEACYYRVVAERSNVILLPEHFQMGPGRNASTSISCNVSR